MTPLNPVNDAEDAKMPAMDLTTVTTTKTIVRIHKILLAKKSYYSLAVNPVTMVKTVLSAMKKADTTLSIEPKPGSSLGTILDPTLLPTDEKTFGEYCEVYEETVVRGGRRLVVAVAVNLSRRLHEIKGDYASGLMNFLQEKKLYVNASVLGYFQQAHIGHLYGLPRVIWRPAETVRIREIMAQTTTIEEAKTILESQGVHDVPLDEDGNPTAVPELLMEVDTPGDGSGPTRVVTTAMRLKTQAKFAKLAIHQLTKASSDPELQKLFDGADYIPPGMSTVVKDFRSFILGHNHFLEAHTVMRVNGLTIDALNFEFQRTNDGPKDLRLHQILRDAGVNCIEETARTDSYGSWMSILPKNKVDEIRKLIDNKLPKLYSQHVPDDPKFHIPGVSCPYRAYATYLNHGGGGSGSSVASGISGISNVSEGFRTIAA